VEEVDATDNRAERLLGLAMTVRKTGGCNRTPGSAQTHAILASLLVTTKQQGQDPLDYLAKVLTARGKLPSLALQQSPPGV